MISVAEASGLGDAIEVQRTRGSARLSASGAVAWDAIAAMAELHPAAIRPTLAMPEAFAEILAAAIALDEASPADGGAALAAHYLDLMPRMRVAQMATRSPPNAALFHTSLEWGRLPRLSGAIDALFARAARACGEAALPGALGARSAAEFRAARPSVAALYHDAYYGGFMPLLYGYPQDLLAMGRALAQGEVHGVIDRWLAAPLLHEICHFAPGRRALLPPYIDECIAAHLGVAALPETAWPAPGEQNALFGAPWLSQVGDALASAVGEEALLRGHAGVQPWDEALPGGLCDALLRLGWDEYARTRGLHFLSSNYRPDPWMKVFFLAAAGEPLADLTLARLADLPWSDVPPGEEAPADAALIERGLRSLCLHNFQCDGTFRVAARPPSGTIAVELAACRVIAPRENDGCDPQPLAHLFPPAVAARLRSAGISGYAIELSDLAALPEVARALLDGAAGRRGPGYQLTRS
ncbi:MAG: hypothetical protein EXR72_04950 [Myxococcales bacterium]|nr:hypothetical protein [Myxococcales bacterium]